jgi:hypothetical protein
MALSFEAARGLVGMMMGDDEEEMEWFPGPMKIGRFGELDWSSLRRTCGVDG